MATSWLPPGVHPSLAGKPFFPAGKDKRPAVSEWRPFADRLPNEQEIASWKNHNGPWGMPCGPLSYVAIDFDGEEGRKFFEAKFDGGELPPTAMTPSGGYHGFFAYPKGPEAALLKNAVRLLPGVDIRCHGGYVIIPSAYPDGRAWLQPPNGTAPPLPGWIIDALKPSKAAQTVSPEADGLPARAEKGTRNKMVSIHAGRYLSKGLSAEETATILQEWNKRNPEPLDEAEVRKTVFSIARREAERTPTVELMDALEIPGAYADPPGRLIDPFLPKGGKGIFAGCYGTFKSTMMLNWAACVQNGVPLFGRFDTVQGNVLVVDRENQPTEVYKRLERITNGLRVPKGGIKFQFPKEKPDLADRRVREGYIKAIEKQKISLVIFDSFLCFTNIQDENQNTMVRGFLELVGEIPAKTGATLMLIDHAGKPFADKNRGPAKVSPRGASAKSDWCDFMATFEEKEDEARKLRIIRFQKTRYCPPLAPMIVEAGPNFVFSPSGIEEICPVFTVRAVVEETLNGIAAGLLYKQLVSLTGCSGRTAMRAAMRTAELGFIDRKERGRNVYYHPARQVTLDLVTNQTEGEVNN